MIVDGSVLGAVIDIVGRTLKDVVDLFHA